MFNLNFCSESDKWDQKPPKRNPEKRERERERERPLRMSIGGLLVS
jgi:hypothetical protein